MAAGGASGAITVWNLEARKLHTIVRDAHGAPLTSLHFFPGEPRLMSAAADNSLKQWVFDAADGSGRLLRWAAALVSAVTAVHGFSVTTMCMVFSRHCCESWQACGSRARYLCHAAAPAQAAHCSCKLP